METHQLSGPLWTGRCYILTCSCGGWSWMDPCEYIWLRELAAIHRELADQPRD